MIPLLSFLAPSRLWLLPLIPALVGLYLWLVQRKRNRNKHRQDDVRPGHPTRPDLAAAPGRRSVDPQPADADGGLRQAQGPGLGAAGTGHRRGDHRHLAVHGGRGRRAQPPGRGQGRGRAVRELAAAEVQRRAGHLRRQRHDGGPAHPGQGLGDRRDRGPRAEPSTAIGEGIYTSLAALAQVPPDPDNPRAVVPARIVLLSDGKTQVGRPSDEAAEAARAQNVPIYTIAYGTANGYIEIGGRREPVPVDRDELERISRISGGEAYTATSAGELKEVYRGHRQQGGQGEGRSRGHLALCRLRPGVRHPRRARADLARRPLAVGR